MLAKHRLEDSLDAIRVFQLTCKVAIDTQPVHFVCFFVVLLTYYRNVIFCLAGDNTSITTCTAVGIY